MSRFYWTPIPLTHYLPAPWNGISTGRSIIGHSGGQRRKAHDRFRRDLDTSNKTNLFLTPSVTHRFPHNQLNIAKQHQNQGPTGLKFDLRGKIELCRYLRSWIGTGWIDIDQLDLSKQTNLKLKLWLNIADLMEIS